jgi:hypothetical protein
VPESTQLESPENVSFRLEGIDAKRFREYKRRNNIPVNATAARKALFDQIDAEEDGVSRKASAA